MNAEIIDLTLLLFTDIISVMVASPFMILFVLGMILTILSFIYDLVIPKK